MAAGDITIGESYVGNSYDYNPSMALAFPNATGLSLAPTPTIATDYVGIFGKLTEGIGTLAKSGLDIYKNISETRIASEAIKAQTNAIISQQRNTSSTEVMKAQQGWLVGQGTVANTAGYKLSDVDPKMIMIGVGILALLFMMK